MIGRFRRALLVLATVPVRLYQVLISPALPPRCKYEPSCSSYAISALHSHGVVRGSILAAWRLLRCNPLSHGGYDPVEAQTLFRRRPRVDPPVSRPVDGPHQHPGSGGLMLVVANILQPLVDIADSILTFFHDDVGIGWGMSIVAMTVVVRLAILPLTIKGIRSMNALRELQPQMKEIQEKYKADKQRQQQEMMKFYKENKINPLGSCLPLLLQIPVFLALFYLLRSEEFAAQVAASPPKGWLFIDDLTEPATGAELAVLIALYVGSQLGASIVMMSTVTDRNQKVLFMLLPFIIVPFILNFPAGLVVYWITTNFWTFGQQVVVRKIAPPPQLAPVAGGSGNGAAAVEKVKKPPPPPRKKKRKRR